MCGRYTLRGNLHQIADQFHAALPEGLFGGARYNIAPTQSVVAIRDEIAEDAPRRRKVAMLRWGLVPSWADDPAIGSRMINARAETVAEKPAFRSAFKRRRCLVVADGFYEWKKLGAAEGAANGAAKQPYFIRMRDDSPFAFAGLWERWKQGERTIESCTVITTEPNRLMQSLHDRMPVIVPAEQYDLWLDPEFQDAKALGELLAPYPAEPMTAYPVTTLVNNPRHESPQCIEPSSDRPPGDVAS